MSDATDRKIAELEEEIKELRKERNEIYDKLKKREEGLEKIFDILRDHVDTCCGQCE